MKRGGFTRMYGTVTAAAAVLTAPLCGCGQSAPPLDEHDASTSPGSPETVTLFPDAPPLPGEAECKVVIRTGIGVTAAHVPACTPVQYATNPPSGGDHWPLWAEYKGYEAEVPRELYVHNLEHGAIVLAYRCPSTGCAEIRATLEEVRAEATSDPRCLTLSGGPEARFVITPDGALDTPVAAAAWGATYTATCLDKASLARFAADHYAQGPEDTCSNAGAVDVDRPDGGAPSCAGGPPDGGGAGGGGAGGAGGGGAGGAGGGGAGGAGGGPKGP
ncbi:DUF3105 domain-containing protein [Sorangium sp. So ce1153]|uniref:DUF3105 domain-containing protein n=1 Tax=Sorangium sp. So ce1153 TaxID=3133333 RepID=UPI003F6141AA